MSDITSSAELLNLTQAMLLAAEAANWDEVEKIELRRQAVLLKLEAEICTTLARQSFDVAVEHLSTVLSINKRVMVMGQQAKMEVAETIKRLSLGTKAVNEYLR
jgi:hypothetical protein